MIQKTGFGEQIAITITRVFRTMGLTLGLLLGVLGVLQPAAAQPIPLGDAALLTPAAAGDNLKPALSEGFTKVGFRGHRGHRFGGRGFGGHRFGGRGLRGHRFGGRGLRGHRFGGRGFGKRRFSGNPFRGHRFGGRDFGGRHHAP